jgi:chorismate mutase
MAVRALRGAITIDRDEPSEVKRRTIDLLRVLFERNELDSDDVISIFFTATGDVRSLPPAAAAREFGLVDVPLLCAQEMDAEVGPDRCIRLMVHVDTPRQRDELRHVFLRGATVLRPELAEPGDESYE